MAQVVVVVGADKESFIAICDACVRDKRAWAPGEDHESVRVRGTLPLAEERAVVDCPNGHGVLVVREGSDAARSFS